MRRRGRGWSARAWRDGAGRAGRDGRARRATLWLLSSAGDLPGDLGRAYLQGGCRELGRRGRREVPEWFRNDFDGLSWSGMLSDDLAGKHSN